MDFVLEGGILCLDDDVLILQCLELVCILPDLHSESDDLRYYINLLALHALYHDDGQTATSLITGAHGRFQIIDSQKNL